MLSPIEFQIHDTNLYLFILSSTWILSDSDDTINMKFCKKVDLSFWWSEKKFFEDIICEIPSLIIYINKLNRSHRNLDLPPKSQDNWYFVRALLCIRMTGRRTDRIHFNHKFVIILIRWLAKSAQKF